MIGKANALVTSASVIAGHIVTSLILGWNINIGFVFGAVAVGIALFLVCLWREYEDCKLIREHFDDA